MVSFSDFGRKTRASQWSSDCGDGSGQSNLSGSSTCEVHGLLRATLRKTSLPSPPNSNYKRGNYWEKGAKAMGGSERYAQCCKHPCHATGQSLAYLCSLGAPLVTDRPLRIMRAHLQGTRGEIFQHLKSSASRGNQIVALGRGGFNSQHLLPSQGGPNSAVTALEDGLATAASFACRPV